MVTKAMLDHAKAFPGVVLTLNNNPFSEKRNEGRRDGDASRRTVLAHAAGWEVDVDVMGLDQVVVVGCQFQLEKGLGLLTS